jgi:pyruvate-formate lyase-activating enzyme
MGLNRSLSVFPPERAGTPLIDNTRRLARIRYRWKAYSKILTRALPHISIRTLACSHFPFYLPDARVPPLLTVELTNACNVACTYCTSPLALRPQGIMRDDTFAKLVASVHAARVSRVRFVGNGEPTLHPQFPRFAREMAQATPFLSIVTNCQRLPEDTLDALLDAPFRLIEVSVDGADPESYESSRRGGSFDRLLQNLRRLKAARDDRRAPALINLRLMLRPSQRQRERQLEIFWQPYGDAVMRQYVIRRRELDGDADVYQNVQRADETVPRCALPFKSLDITWTGLVPLCHYSAAQIGEPGLIVGDINKATVEEIWNGTIMSEYRRGHRQRDSRATPICRGCSAG